MGGAQRSRVRWERVSCVPGTNEIRLKADVVVILVVDKGPLEGSTTNSQTPQAWTATNRPLNEAGRTRPRALARLDW